MRSVFAPIMAIGLLSGSADAQQAPVRLEPVTRIGCLDCAGAELFASIQVIAVGNGRVYVSDNSAPFVRVFDTRGRLLRAFARKGNGPGELQLPIHLGPRRNGALEVYDMRQRRFTRYDSAGAELGTRTVRDFVALAVSAPGAGESYLLTTDFRSQNQPLLRLADGSSDATTIATLDAAFPKLAPDEHARTPALAARPGGGVVVGDGVAEYRIRRFDAAGKSLGDIVRPLQRTKKTAAELAEERERWQRRLGRMQAMRRAEGGSGAPAAFTPREERNHFNMDALCYDEHGRLWVRTERGGLSATVFDLFDGDRYLGELRINERLGTFALADGLLAAKVVDADEVEFVRVWRVR